ncbi:protein of unknown function [Catalinimonas alkaloidigena]|uniref:DUF748 domain-containing protein n=1 Tax=Catalinimonas alkaloidigena TaxID=1075417 RepID=A0A1G9D6R9_9BACT|nr:DUF748 domain-containing protein [Catalinimonas alkaloidigena]SDK59608.1 protein of unknown function [Catalinimonas alkaloidigena]
MKLSKWSKRTWITLGVLVVLLVALRIALPSIVKHYLNGVLDDGIEGYTGHVADVDIMLYRGAYGIDSLRLQKVEGDVPVPFIDLDRIDFAIEWPALLDGAIRGKILLDHPQVNFVDAPNEADGQAGDETSEADWRQTIDELFPLSINRFEIRNGEIRFRNFTTKPAVDIAVNNLFLVATNLTNTEDSTNQLVSDLHAKAQVLGDGDITLEGGFSLLEDPMPFDINLALENVNLPVLNDFFLAYAGFDMEKGTLDLYTEVATEENQFTGYVKPILKDIQVLSLKNDPIKPRRLLWESGVSLVSFIFKNIPKDQFATEIPISGELNNPDVDVWKTIVNVLKNAFIEAYAPQLDNDVDLSDVGVSKKELKEIKKEQKKEERQKEDKKWYEFWK